MRIFVVLTLLLCLHFSVILNAQDYDTSDIEYIFIPEDYFKGYEYATLKIDYYFTDGYSYGDRYWYEIIVVDSMLLLHFHSEGSDSYNKLFFEKKRIINKSQIELLKTLLVKSNLKQSKEGIPRARFSAYTQEVFIVNYKDIVVRGGMAYGNSASYPDNESYSQILKEIEKDRHSFSSISGDYDAVIDFLKSLFNELPKLFKKMKIE